MRKLQKNWLTDGLIDFEYKKYLLLAYLKHVHEHFKQKKLYPELSDLQFHYQDSLTLRQNQQDWSKRLSRKLLGLDWERLQLQYGSEFQELSTLKEVEDILCYAIPRFGEALHQGEEILQEVDTEVTITPIGIVPLFKKEGYLFVYANATRRLEIYQYKVPLFERQLHTSHIETRYKNYTTTFESIKLDLVRQRRQLPNPASYLVESKWDYPLEETLLPIAQRKMNQWMEDED
ncbi:MAG: hypothetical protein QM669_03205 [Siphonobacter sp.]